VLLLLGIMSLLLAVVDGLGALFGWSLTEVSWSPLLFLVLGFVFLTLESWQTRPS
jgi:hypothetical protein